MRRDSFIVINVSSKVKSGKQPSILRRRYLLEVTQRLCLFLKLSLSLKSSSHFFHGGCFLLGVLRKIVLPFSNLLSYSVGTRTIISVIRCLPGEALSDRSDSRVCGSILNCPVALRLGTELSFWRSALQDLVGQLLAVGAEMDSGSVVMFQNQQELKILIKKVQVHKMLELSAPFGASVSLTLNKLQNPSLLLSRVQRKPRNLSRTLTRNSRFFEILPTSRT
jgi:hypothetical protein